jgi:hypothetical protein
MADEPLHSAAVYLERIWQECRKTRELMSQFVNDMRQAESEIPESIRRFMNYFHDCHDIKHIYEEHGVEPPEYLMRELERLHDRYRQLVGELNAGGGTFDKVRREMATDPMNRYDHTRLLAQPTHKRNGDAEARSSRQEHPIGGEG